MSNNVQVTVSANSSQFSTGLAQVQNSLNSFKHHATAQFSELGHELLAGLALTGIIEGIKELIEHFSEVGDQAERLGISAESVQRLSLVAKTSGMEMEALAKTLQKGSKNAVDAVAGNEELAQAFQKLGVEAKEFVNATPEEQLILLSEGYEKSGQNAETLNAILKALGKSGADLIPILIKGPEALREELAGVNVASNTTVATLKEAGDNLEVLWNTVKVAGADALDWIINRTKALGTGFAAIAAYIEALPQGLHAAAKAYDEVLDAEAELQLEHAKKKEEEHKKRKPVDTDRLENAKKEAEEKKKLEEEIAKLKEENAKKEEEAHFRNLSLLAQKAELEEKIAVTRAQMPLEDALGQEKSWGKVLDMQKELEHVNSEVSKEKEKEDKRIDEEAKKAEQEKAKEELKLKKEALKEATQTQNELERAQKNSFSVDSLRQIGGGLRGVNYNANAAKDDMQRQQIDLARQQVDKLQKIVDSLESSQQDMPQYDGSFN